MNNIYIQFALGFPKELLKATYFRRGGYVGEISIFRQLQEVWLEIGGWIKTLETLCTLAVLWAISTWRYMKNLQLFLKPSPLARLYQLFVLAQSERALGGGFQPRWGG